MKYLEELPEIKSTLLYIAKELNKKGIKWALGGSLLLHIKGIKTSVDDIDILVADKDLSKLIELVEKYKHIEKTKTDIYLTDKFFSITIKDVNIDLMLGFKIKFDSNVYSFPSNDNLVREEITIMDTKIYLSSLKDWLDAYKAMKREDKVKLIVDHFELR